MSTTNALRPSWDAETARSLSSSLNRREGHLRASVAQQTDKADKVDVLLAWETKTSDWLDRIYTNTAMPKDAYHDYMGRIGKIVDELEKAILR